MNCKTLQTCNKMKTVFYNKNGSLTKYALSCGYVEQIENKEDRNLRLTMFVEHGHIHVKSYALNVWEVFSAAELGKAKKLYNTLKQAVINKDYDFKLTGITQ